MFTEKKLIYFIAGSASGKGSNVVKLILFSTRQLISSLHRKWLKINYGGMHWMNFKFNYELNETIVFMKWLIKLKWDKRERTSKASKIKWMKKTIVLWMNFIYEWMLSLPAAPFVFITFKQLLRVSQFILIWMNCCGVSSAIIQFKFYWWRVLLTVIPSTIINLAKFNTCLSTNGKYCYNICIR